VIVGIDLGTSNSLVAFINREGKAEIIINERGSRLTPSVVYFKNEQEVMVGELARSQLILKADRTISSIKRQMGTNYQVEIGERGYTPPEISGLILRKLLQYAQEYLEQEITAAVVTVPAYFNDNQRQATLLAGEMASIKILKLLNEPTAAALAYGVNREKKENILVLDIGGGTFDITLMEYQDEVCQVLCIGGSSQLGGLDFDKQLVKHILETFKMSNGIDLSADPIALQQIHINAEKAKVDLSSINECSILVPYITMGAQGPVHLNQALRREEFNHICSHLFKEISELIEQTFTRAGVSKEWVEAVVLAGGASRMPGFKDLVKQLFPGVELRVEINPDEVVALGAALEGGMLSGELSHIETHDVTGHTLGVEDNQGEFVSIIPANTPYPISESRLFTTVNDFQEEVIIHILQQDELGDAGEGINVSLGKFHLENIQKAKAGEPSIDVTFTIDENGILNVSALDIETGTQKEIQITETGYVDGNKIPARRGRDLIIL
jgi:molecular chaperone DnaK